jgi:hypothetical protein
MGNARAGSRGGGSAGRRGWRLVGAPPPTLSERLGRAVGCHVLRMPGSRRVFVLAGSMDRLRELLADPASLAPTKSASIVVAWWRWPRRGWSGGLGPLSYVVRHQVSLPTSTWGRGPAAVHVRLARPVPFRDILGAALHALGPTRPLPEPASANLTADGLLPAYLPTQPTSAVFFDELPESPDIRAHDVVFRRVGTATVVAEPPPYAVAYPAGRHDVRPAAGEPVVLVDARRINPRGRRASAYQPDAPRVRLDFGAQSRWRGSGIGRGRQLDGPGLDSATLASLRQVGVVDCPRIPDVGPVETAALLVQLAMTGVVVHAPTLPAQVAELLAPDLRDLLTAPVIGADALAMEARSVRQRRAALRGHATAFALPRLTAGVFPELRHPPSVSAILATRRPEMLAAALGAITAQSYPDLEIILCLHGIELPDQLRAVLSECGRPFEIVHVPATASFGEALGAATRRARGSLVTKFDDDDTYSSEHVWDLVLARHYSGATLVGKGSEFVYLETLGVTVRRPSGVAEADGDLVAGGTMLLARGDLESVGGWRPVPRSVDHGLIERLRREGAVIYRTHPLGYIYHRRATGHTWDPGQQYFLDNAFVQWEGIPSEALADPRQPPADDDMMAAANRSAAAG